MTTPAPLATHERRPPPSVLTFILQLLEGARTVLLLAVIGFAGGMAAGLTAPAVFSSSAAFMPSAAERGGSGLSGLAGQFGVRLPGGGGAMSLNADALLEILRSTVLLEALASDSITRADSGGGTAVPMPALFGVEHPERAVRRALTARVLRERVSVQHDRRSEIVRVSVATRWPEVSRGVLEALLAHLERHVARIVVAADSAALAFAIRQSRVAQQRLGAAEEALTAFDGANRGARLSPVLQMRRERLMREVTIAQALFSSVEQTRIEASLRTLRSAKAVVVLEQPTAPAIRDARGTVGKALLGAVIGALLGMVLVAVRGQFLVALHAGDEDAAKLARLASRLRRSRPA
jgi:uncharacterized protein involved in exopolysaccharide biosynthesis